MNDIHRKDVTFLIIKRLRVLSKELGKPALAQADESMRLFGDTAHLDSIGLVTLIADLEQDIFEQFGKRVTLADEKAMSRLTSPFRRVGLLADYIVEVVNSR